MQTAALQPSFSATLRDLMELAKPRITVMVVVSVWVGFILGAQGVWDWLTLSATLVGGGALARKSNG